MKRAFQLALLTGALWALIETLLLYVTGAAQSTEVFGIYALVLSTSFLCFGLLALIRRAKPLPLVDFLIECAVLLPVVVFSVRARLGLFSLDALGAGAVLLTSALFVVSRVRRFPTQGVVSPVRLMGLTILYCLAAMACAVRSDSLHTLTAGMVRDAAVFLAVAVVGVGVVARLSRHHVMSAVSVTALVASAVVAFVRGSGAPRFEETVLSSPPTVTAPTGAPNVVLVVLDTVRVDHLDLYGYARPTFTKSSAYLRDGLIFDRATSNGTFSLTSHGALFTGLLPSAHGAYPSLQGGPAVYGRLAPDTVTLAQSFHERGYLTVGVSANDVFLAAWTGLQKGFDSFLAAGQRRIFLPPTHVRLRSMMMRANWVARVRAGDTWDARDVTDAAVEVVGRARRPYFLFLNYFDAHSPHIVMGSPAWIEGKGGVPKPIDAYDSEIAFIDTELARLLKTLKDKGELDRTLVVVAADHGEYFGERGRIRGHPPVTYEGSTHIPLIVRLPGVIPSERTERRTGLNEMFRLIQDVSTGTSIDWVRLSDPTPRILTEAWARVDYPKPRPTDGRPSVTVVFSGNLKLIHRLSGRHELFDVAADPGEEKNLIDSTDPRLVALKERMIKEVGLRKTGTSTLAPPLSEDAKERLRALGYLR